MTEITCYDPHDEHNWCVCPRCYRRMKHRELAIDLLKIILKHIDCDYSDHVQNARQAFDHAHELMRLLDKTP